MKEQQLCELTGYDIVRRPIISLVLFALWFRDDDSKLQVRIVDKKPVMSFLFTNQCDQDDTSRTIRSRTIRFRDEVGLPLEEIQEFSTEDEEDEVLTGLLLSPLGVEDYDTAVSRGTCLNTVK